MSDQAAAQGKAGESGQDVGMHRLKDSEVVDRLFTKLVRRVTGLEVEDWAQYGEGAVLWVDSVDTREVWGLMKGHEEALGGDGDTSRKGVPVAITAHNSLVSASEISRWVTNLSIPFPKAIIKILLLSNLETNSCTRLWSFNMQTTMFV